MESNMEGKIAVITGGARGFGKGFAEILLKKGAKVAILDILDKEGKQTVVEFCNKYGDDRSIYIHCDVSCLHSINGAMLEFFTKYHYYDILINNAGIGDEEQFDKSIDINLKAVVALGIQAAKYMNKQTGGRGGLIVNIASLAGLVASPLLPAYSAAKSGVVGFTKSLAETMEFLGPDTGVKVVCMCPGFTNTQMVSQLKGVIQESEAGHRFFKSFVEPSLMPVSMVMEAFEEIISSNSVNGSVLSLIKHTGMKYVYPKSMRSKL